MKEEVLRWLRGSDGEIGRESLLALARMPVVQVLLAVTVVGQVVTVQARGRVDTVEAGVEQVAVAGAASQDVEVQRVELEPARVDADPAVRRAWLARAMEREGERLAAEYRTQGYNVPARLGEQIAKAAIEYEIDLETAFGLVRAESSFRNAATSPVGAVGLTQLMPRTAAWMEPGVTRAQLRDPETNLRIGFKYLRYLIDKYEGDENLALLAYNRGPGTVDRALQRGRNPDNGYADFVRGKPNHGHRLFTR